MNGFPSQPLSTSRQKKHTKGLYPGLLSKPNCSTDKIYYMRWGGSKSLVYQIYRAVKVALRCFVLVSMFCFVSLIISDFHSIGTTGPIQSQNCHIRLCVCLRHRVQFFFRPLLGPEVTRSVRGLSLLLPPPHTPPPTMSRCSCRPALALHTSSG